MNAEQIRLKEAREQKAPSKNWGPYLSESGERCARTIAKLATPGTSSLTIMPGPGRIAGARLAWGDFRRQAAAVFRLALWNGMDSIFKERFFGLTNSGSNHGEDVKEYYFCLDSTPIHSYMKFLYKYA